MSSAILYLAIVAIWAVVLVPRWLRPRSSQPQPTDQPAEPLSAEPLSGEPLAAEPLAAEPLAAEPLAAEPQSGSSQPGEPQPGEPAEAPLEAVEPPAEPVPVASVAADGEWHQPDAAPADAPVLAEDTSPGPAAPAPPSSAARRTEVVRARRRLLAMIVVLTAGAVGLAVTGIAAFWVIIPPAALLAGFLVLLRGATRIDTERARRAAQARHTAPGRVASQEPDSVRADVAASPDQVPVTASAPDTTEAPPGAEIIDISGRISDQVYDQYADAADRAVGD